MARRSRRNSTEDAWEQALVEAYYDYRWRMVLEPLYDEFVRWKAGELTHDDMDAAIHRTHKETRRLFTLFTERREFLVRAIPMDSEWFAAWEQNHPRPPEAGTSIGA